MNTITLRTFEESLILIPHLLGYQPRHHVILLSLDHRGSDSTGRAACIGPMVAVDLTQVEDIATLSNALREAAHRCRVTCGVLAFFDAEPSHLSGGAHIEVESSLRSLCEDLPGQIRAFRVRPSGWVDLERPDDVRGWEVLEASEVAAALVFAGSSPQEFPPPTLVACKSEQELEVARLAGLRWVDTNSHELELAGCRLWTELLEMLDASISDVAAGLAGEANAALALDGVRDRVLLHALSPGGALPLESVTREALTSRLSEIMYLRPAARKCTIVRNLFDECAAYAQPDDPHALGASAYLAWWMGSNTLAAARAHQALEAEPLHNLALLLAESISSSVLPPWAEHALSG
ncbi:DUF4192 family protein [Changpingibacter yushuensis]|uniref:DUF4192 family protein n=1 Tax=Changpingibacter yushuensis TaxID=2758440 RepID=UPI00165D3013|nr:DUF4192 family protein [Changpingibacter yushuensis]